MSLNIGVPTPRMTGVTRIQYSSIRPSWMSVAARLALPNSARSLPGRFFNRVTSSPIFPLTSLELAQSSFFSVQEKTALGSWFSRPASRAGRGRPVAGKELIGHPSQENPVDGLQHLAGIAIEVGIRELRGMVQLPVGPFHEAVERHAHLPEELSQGRVSSGLECFSYRYGLCAMGYADEIFGSLKGL